MKGLLLAIVAGSIFFAPAALATPLSISIEPAPANPVSPQMGDTLSFHTVIRNAGNAPVAGLIAWPGLVQVDEGKEQPVDLEDWSAHKAVTAASLVPGGTIETDWPMRLIQAGHYRIVVSAASRTGAELAASPFADFTVRQKPVVESQRVLSVALGIPLLLGAAALWRRPRHPKASQDAS